MTINSQKINVNGSTVWKLRVKEETNELKISWQYKKAKAERKYKKAKAERKYKKAKAETKYKKDTYLRHSPLDLACPSFENLFFFSPLFCSTPFYGIFHSTPLPPIPTLMQLPPALIRPTKLPWLKQVLKGWFYQLSYHCLLKISFKSLYK